MRLFSRQQETVAQGVLTGTVALHTRHVVQGASQKKFCTGFRALLICLLFEKVQNLDSYRTKFYNEVFALQKNVKSGTTAANCTLCDIVIAQVLCFETQKMMKN